MSMRIGDYAGISAGFQNNTSKAGKYNNVRDYSNYLMGKYSCLKPGNNAAVSVTSGLLKKAMADEETGAWLERELAKAPDYIAAAQKSAIAHGSTLKSVSIEFGEEYSTMCTLVVTDGGGTDPEIDKWLEKVKENQAKKKEEEKKLEQRKSKAQELEKSLQKIELKGYDLEDLMHQFTKKLSVSGPGNETGSFDVRA
ncbi:DUF6033 family protein [Butyrivibrio sp.]|uniref:DUF6033 family protein n=1 Tax=Butyrivibrio sp. TaxID=28121 RepID=UPI0025C17424|nr:DUF6033 family protein [Butyrivibrio sp.]MBE5839058.1 hypothetical protein [Butyrivibrio sp.]